MIATKYNAIHYSRENFKLQQKNKKNIFFCKESLQRKNEKILAKNGKKNGEIVGNKMIAIFFFTIYN